VRLRHQALILALALGCAACGGCARLLGTILAPQQAGMAAANQVANRAAAPVVNPARSELAAVDSEVGRLLGGKGANQQELQRIKQELERRINDDGRGPSAQGEAERLRPWHPRVPAEDPLRLRKPVPDKLRLGAPAGERGLASVGRLPDGIAAGELQAPLDLSRIRLQRR